MKRLKLVTSGPNKNYRPGQVVEVDDERAKALIAAEAAVIDDGMTKKPKSKGSKG